MEVTTVGDVTVLFDILTVSVLTENGFDNLSTNLLSLSRTSDTRPLRYL